MPLPHVVTNVVQDVFAFTFYRWGAESEYIVEGGYSEAGQNVEIAHHVLKSIIWCETRCPSGDSRHAFGVELSTASWRSFIQLPELTRSLATPSCGHI